MSALRILEIGDRILLAREHAAWTTLAWSGADRLLPEGLGPPRLDRPHARALAGAIRDGSFDAVVLHVPEREPWRESRLGLGRPRAWHAWWLARSLSMRSATRLVVVDTRDRATMSRTVAGWLARAEAYFLRECPADVEGWVGSANARHAAKVAPLSIGLSRDRFADVPSSIVEKSVDVFFAGQTDTPLRRAEWPALRELARTGLRIDAPASPLPRDEFLRRCAAAWIVWSPEGRGWQCFRPLEAAACRSVPLMNRPTIRLHEPLVDGVHALYYDPGPGALAKALIDALADKARLARMAEASRSHVLRHHTHAAMCRRILEPIYASMPK